MNKPVNEFESIDKLKKYYEDRKNYRNIYLWKKYFRHCWFLLFIILIFIPIPLVITSFIVSKGSCSRIEWVEEKTNITFHDCTQKQIDHDNTRYIWKIMYIPVIMSGLWIVMMLVVGLTICILDCLDDRKLKKKLAQFNELEMQA